MKCTRQCPDMQMNILYVNQGAEFIGLQFANFMIPDFIYHITEVRVYIYCKLPYFFPSRHVIISLYPSICCSVFLSPLGALSPRQLLRRGRHERRRAGGDKTVLLLLSTFQQGQRRSITSLVFRPCPLRSRSHPAHISHK